MRYLFLLGILNFFFVDGACKGLEEEVNLICTLQGCGRTLSLYEFDGGTFKEVMKVESKSDSIFSFKLKKSDPVFYYIGVEPSGAIPIIVGPESTLEVSARCGSRLVPDFSKSPLNKNYLALKEQMREYQSNHVKLVNQFRQFKRDPDQQAFIAKKIGKLDDEKVDFLDSLKIANPYFAKIAALNTYLSFQSNGDGYDNEVTYFAEQFFQFVDFEDETYNYIPWVYEMFKSYSNTLSSVRIDNGYHLNSIQKQIEKFPITSRARKLALSAVVSTLREKNHTNFVAFAEQFIKEYQEQDPGAAKDLEKIVRQKKAFTIGGEAPDFGQPSPEGDEIRLNDFRGKWLLVDFWASWCGPCRKENPNVVAMYEKYKNKGFEILGVSLDKSKDRWVNAIQQDGLTWPQISDLKGWRNEVAQLYGVRSIPQTLLLDREGKIVARNLRGRSLEEKLEEIFGEP